MANKTYTFVVNDDSIVNEYGYRVMTAGIDTTQYERNPVVLYMHNRAMDSPKSVVARAVSMTKSGSQLIAEVEFDEDEADAKILAGKVERGFIKMASIHADVKGTSTDPRDILPEQTYETVTQCKLVELSIVDIGGNDNALRLSRNGHRIKLQKIDKTDKKKEMSIKSIALALGLGEDEKESTVLKSVNDLKLAKDAADKKATDLETKLNGIKKAEAETIISKAVTLGLINEALTPAYATAFENDHDAQKALLSKLIDDAEADSSQDEKHTAVKEVLLSAKGGKTPKGNVKLSFDYLQKHDVQELRRLRDEEPKKYAQLAKDYANGVRSNQDN